MSAAAFAINEQRFAPNMKNVVATDEYGDIAEGNIAEFLKFLPGINIDYAGGNARDVSIDGVPGDYVPVTIDGFSLASAVGGGAGGTNRSVGLDQVSINNISRVEVDFSPTPDSQGNALAGSVNMVPRSSFERSKPLFNFSTYVMMRDNAKNWSKTPAPRHPTRKIHPGADFSYVAPVDEESRLHPLRRLQPPILRRAADHQHLARRPGPHQRQRVSAHHARPAVSHQRPGA
jgi:hypothetical protein